MKIKTIKKFLQNGQRAVEIKFSVNDGIDGVLIASLEDDDEVEELVKIIKDCDEENCDEEKEKEYIFEEE